MPDGSRKRRFSPIKIKRQWYARHRALRFAYRLSGRISTPPIGPLLEPCQSRANVSV